MSQVSLSVRENPHCLICNSRVGVSTRNSVQVFSKQVQTSSEQSMSAVISGVVGKTLTEQNVHTLLICKKCFKLFLEYDELETRLYEIKSEIINNYKRTILKYENSYTNNESESIEAIQKELLLTDVKKEPLDDTEIEMAKIISKPKKILKNSTGHSEEKSQDPNEEDIEKQMEKLHRDGEQHDKTNNVSEMMEGVEVINEDGDNVPQISIPDTSDQDDSSQNFQDFGQDDEPVDAGAIDNSDDSDYQPPMVLEVIQNGDSDGDKHGDENTAALLEAAALAEQTIQEDGSIVFNVKLEPGLVYKDVKHVMKSKMSMKNMIRNKTEDNHRELVSREGSSYTCLVCAEEGSHVEGDGKAMMAHVKGSHELRVYICDVCGDYFRKRNELSAHLDEHVAAEEGDFQCEVCNRIFSNLRLFRIHKRMHYPQSKLWACETCGKRYSSRNLLDEHINTHTGVRPYICTVCSKDFASKYTFRAHMKTHEVRPRPFACSQCEKSFLSAQNLTQHERTHTGIKDYICHLCGKAFGSPHNLEVHSIVHTGYKPFICRTCGKAFARKAEIRDHERTHTGERPYQCEFCGATFSQRSNLQSHKRATHYDDKRYKCAECNKGFKRRRLLDYHIKAVHTGERPFKCNLCEATFVYPEHFKKHRRVHTGEKPFLCEVCGKAFNSRDNRNAHRFVHSDKKPYECLVCGMGFMRKPLLYAHMEAQGHLNDTIIVNQPRLTTDEDQLVTFSMTDDMEVVGEEETQDLDENEDTKLYITTDLKDHVIIKDAEGNDSAVIVGTTTVDMDQDTVEHLIIDGQTYEILEKVDVTADSN